MKDIPFVTISSTAKLAIVVFCVVGIISPCKAAGDMSTIAYDTENKNHHGGQGGYEQRQIPTVSQKEQTRKLDSPSCTDSPLAVLTGKKLRSAKTCEVIAKRPVRYCKNKAINSHCPRACDACEMYGSADSEGAFIFEGVKKNCKWNRKLRATPSTLTQISDWCQKDGIRETCRETCSSFCAIEVTSSPSIEPTSFPTSIPSAVPSHPPTVMPCAEKVKSVINSKFGDFVDDSPQGYALDWLIGDIGEGNCDNQDKIVQRFVLAAFYFSTDGDAWRNNSGWLGLGDECSWYGLTCDGNNAVSQIRLSRNNLSGTILHEIYALGSLEYMDIAYNEASGLSGTIPESIGRLEKLYHLDLRFNALTGTIPDMSGLVNMQNFQTANNDLRGQITDQFEGMTKLNLLNLERSGLTGTIPAMTGLTSLEYLNLSDNDFTGQITDQFEGMTKLKQINIGSNALTGSIPGFSTNTDLNRLYLFRNNLDGELDSGIFALPKLEYLVLSSNKLTGPIPDNFGGSASLQFLILDDNLLTGPIPDITGDSLQSIVNLQMQKNKMSDPVPDTLCTLRSSKPDQFKYLVADCAPRDSAQNECPPGCCTDCFVGKGEP